MKGVADICAMHISLVHIAQECSVKVSITSAYYRGTRGGRHKARRIAIERMICVTCSNAFVNFELNEILR